MTNCPTTPPHTAQQSCHGIRSVRSHLHTEHSSPAMVYDQSDHTSTQSTAVLPWFTISPITPPHTAQQSCHGLRSVRSHLHTQHSSPAMVYDQSDHTSTHSTAVLPWFTISPITPPHRAQQSCHGLRSVRSHLHTQHSTAFSVLFHLCRTHLVVRLDRCHSRVHIGSLSCSTRTQWLRLPYLHAGTAKQKRYITLRFL